MQFYLVAFAFHIALLYLSARIDDKRFGLVLAIISVLPLCVVAGARDITVGTDTSAYPLSCFNASQVYSPIGALSACSDQEPLFVLLFWFLGRLTGDFNVVLFFCELFIFLPYVLVAKKQFPQGYPVIGFFLCFIVFGYTLNILRQCLATSALVLMVYELIHGKNLPAFVFLAIAVGFHKMSIVGIFVWVIYIACCESRSVRSSKTLAMLFCLGIAICAVSAVLIGPDLMDLVSSFTSSYSFQVKHAGMGSLNNTMLIYLLFCMIMKFLGHKSSMESTNREMLNFYICCGVFSAVFAQFASISPELIRLSFPFLFISGFLYPFLSENLGNERLLSGVLAITFCVLYFAITFVFGGSCDLFPYSSALLGVFYA